VVYLLTKHEVLNSNLSAKKTKKLIYLINMYNLYISLNF
jgi:hypothetical protein